MIGDIRQHLEAAPFEPFTIVTTSGRRYSVATADHVGLNPRGNRVVVWFDDDSSVTISGLHIASIEKGSFGPKWARRSSGWRQRRMSIASGIAGHWPGMPKPQRSK